MPQVPPAQMAAWITWGLPPHWAKQVWGCPPAWTQAMMHWSSLSQTGFWRHAEAWAQQLAARQLPQAVPSEGHIGGPQRPPLH